VRFFKETIDFRQFVAELITLQLDFLEKSFNKLIELADESKVLTEKDKEDFLDKAPSLAIVDITLQSTIRFRRYLTSEEAGEAVSIVYAKYLTEYREIPRTVAEGQLEQVIRLMELVGKAEEDVRKRNEYYRETGVKSFPKINSHVDKERFYLCTAFAEYFAGEDVKSESWLARRFAAFKFAKALTKADILAAALKHYKVTF